MRHRQSIFEIGCVVNFENRLPSKFCILNATLLLMFGTGKQLIFQRRRTTRTPDKCLSKKKTFFRFLIFQKRFRSTVPSSRVAYYDYYYVTGAPNSTGRNLFIQIFYYVLSSPFFSLSLFLCTQPPAKSHVKLSSATGGIIHTRWPNAHCSTHTTPLGCRRRRPLGYYMNFDLWPFFFLRPSVRLFYDPDTFKPDENTTPFGPYAAGHYIAMCAVANARKFELQNGFSKPFFYRATKAEINGKKFRNATW